MKKSIAAFEAANPTIKINLREFSNTDYQKELPLALNGGQSLDVVGVQISAMTNTVRTQLRPVSDWQSNLPADWQSKINSHACWTRRRTSPRTASSTRSRWARSAVRSSTPTPTS